MYEVGKQLGGAIIDGWIDMMVEESSRLADMAKYIPGLGGIVEGIRAGYRASSGRQVREDNLRAFGASLGIAAPGEAMDRATRSAGSGSQIEVSTDETERLKALGYVE